MYLIELALSVHLLLLRFDNIEYLILFFLILSIALILILRRHFAMSPSNDRSWVNDNERLATVEFEGDIALFRNVRDFNWRTTKDYDERWIDVRVDLSGDEDMVCTRIF